MCRTYQDRAQKLKIVNENREEAHKLPKQTVKNSATMDSAPLYQPSNGL